MTARGRGPSASVFLAALLIGVSLAAVVWGLEQAVQGRMREHRRSELQTTLQDARRLLVARGVNAADAASQLAGSSTIQGAFITRNVPVLRRIADRRPDVGFVLWNGKTLGHKDVPGLDVAVGVYGGGLSLGRVVVSASPTPRLLESARARHGSVDLWFTVGGDVRLTSPATAAPDLARQRRTRQNDSLALSNGPVAAGLTAFVSKPHLPVSWLWPLLVGLVSGAGALTYFRRAEHRRSSEPPPKTVRDAVALVGETLAATHNPDALLPVILQAAIEATDASGGSISSDDIVLASHGGAEAATRKPLEFPLKVAGGRSAVLALYPPPAGFTDEAKDAAAWIAAQALIALENAHLHGLVQRQAVTDELTGLANRRQFLSQMEAEVARSRRSGSPLAVVLADLDDFKQVNDKYGHEAGDKTLRAFADILREAVRDIDLPVRLGGEEFAILLPDTDLAGGGNLAERIRAMLAERRIESGSARIAVTASFGVSCFPQAAAADDLLVDADRRLYDAKRRGKNRVEVSSSANHVELA